MIVLFANEKCGYYGGVEQVIVDSAAGLRKRGHRCYLAYRSKARADQQYAEAFNACTPCADFGAEPPAKSFQAIVHDFAVDVVYYHKVAKLPEPVLDVRTVRVIHDHDLYCPTGYKYFRQSGRTCSHKADWRCYADLAFLEKNPAWPLGIAPVSIRRKIKEMQRNYRLDALLPISTYVRDTLLMNGFPKDKLHILNPTLPLGVHAPSPVPAAPRVLFVGQLVRGKGVDLLLHALALLHSPFTATIIGTGNAEQKLKELCSQFALDDRVQFMGWVDHKDIGDHYANAKVLAVPARWPEPFGLIGQEAMLNGRPVVAFDVGGIADWLEHEQTGLLAPEQDIPAFSQALERLLSDTESARRMGKTAFERGRSLFSFETYIDQLERHLAGDTI